MDVKPASVHVDDYTAMWFGFQCRDKRTKMSVFPV